MNLRISKLLSSFCGNTLRRLIGVTLASLISTSSMAELADRNKPVNLEADNVVLDDLKQISTFQGNVQLTQGSMTIKADKLLVKQDASGFQHATAYGNPVQFRQKREGLNEYIEGYAERMEYDAKADTIELFSRARIKRNQDEVRGNYISYNSKTEVFQVVSGGKAAATGNNPQGRVRAVIQPKSKTNTPATPGSGTSIQLKPADKIANPRETN